MQAVIQLSNPRSIYRTTKSTYTCRLRYIFHDQFTFTASQIHHSKHSSTYSMLLALTLALILDITINTLLMLRSSLEHFCLTLHFITFAQSNCLKSHFQSFVFFF